MNRVLLCGVCVGAVLSLLGEECASVTLLTASDGSVKQKVTLDCCENAQSILKRDGLCYQAQASFTAESGVTLSGCAHLLEQSPALVTFLMQNIARHLTDEGVSVSFSVTESDFG